MTNKNNQIITVAYYAKLFLLIKRKIKSLKKSTPLTILGILAFSVSVWSQDRQEIKTEYGIVSGKKAGEAGVYAFKGIPFASPPVGDLRWRPPVPPKPWTGVKNADQFGASPMQDKPVPFMVYTPEFLIPQSPISEDCLYLNVWTAAKSGKEKRPVIVWIYGGGFVSGGTGCEIYDGTAMASNNVVFVSINYRVGIFGFFSHPELSSESPNKVSGNYGILDQIAALQWVKKNVSAFGGDPDNITIAGQSAGAFSVCALVASPLARGLFHKAIAQSGSSVVADPKVKPHDLAAAETEGMKVSQYLKGASLAELRKVPADTLLKARKGIISRPVVDGYVLPAPIPEIFKAGKQADVPLLTGWNADDALIASFRKSDVYLADAEKIYGPDAGEFLKNFPGSTDAEAVSSQIALSRDKTFGIGNAKWAAIQTSGGKNAAYVYFFARRPPAEGDFEKYGAFHTAEVPYAYGNLKYFKRPLQPEDHALSKTMLQYWVNFAKTGNPNGDGLPKWPEFREADAQVMILSEKPAAGELPGKAGMEFLYRFMMK